jgi:hypothetical protein
MKYYDTGRPLPQLEAYLNGILEAGNPAAKYLRGCRPNDFLNSIIERLGGKRDVTYRPRGQHDTLNIPFITIPFLKIPIIKGTIIIERPYIATRPEEQEAHYASYSGPIFPGVESLATKYAILLYRHEIKKIEKRERRRKKFR